MNQKWIKDIKLPTWKLEPMQFVGDRIIVWAFVCVFLSGMVLAAVIHAALTQDPTTKVLEAYNQGKKDALTIKRGNVDLELTCAALWQSNQPFLGEKEITK
jgi:hypothetical protein